MCRRNANNLPLNGLFEMHKAVLKEGFVEAGKLREMEIDSDKPRLILSIIDLPGCVLHSADVTNEIFKTTMGEIKESKYMSVLLVASAPKKQPEAGYLSCAKKGYNRFQILKEDQLFLATSKRDMLEYITLLTVNDYKADKLGKPTDGVVEVSGLDIARYIINGLLQPDVADGVKKAIFPE